MLNVGICIFFVLWKIYFFKQEKNNKNINNNISLVDSKVNINAKGNSSSASFISVNSNNKNSFIKKITIGTINNIVDVGIIVYILFSRG